MSKIKYWGRNARKGLVDISRFICNDALAVYTDALGSNAAKYYTLGTATAGAVIGAAHGHPVIGTVAGFVFGPATNLGIKMAAELRIAGEETWSRY